MSRTTEINKELKAIYNSYGVDYEYQSLGRSTYYNLIDAGLTCDDDLLVDGLVDEAMTIREERNMSAEEIFAYHFG